jgi:hypothetical protein
MHETTEVPLETKFSTRSVPRSCKEDNWANQISSVRESEGNGSRHPEWTSTREAEDFSLLEDVAMKRLAKAGKNLAGALVICEFLRLAMTL